MSLGKDIIFDITYIVNQVEIDFRNAFGYWFCLKF